jgi:hypothetical protein
MHGARGFGADAPARWRVARCAGHQALAMQGASLSRSTAVVVATSPCPQRSAAEPKSNLSDGDIIQLLLYS